MTVAAPTAGWCVTAVSCVLTGLSDITALCNIRQSLKGILTAGLAKSVRYSGRKLVKMTKSMRR